MERILLFSLLIIVASLNSYAQKERKIVREGVREYKDQKYTEAEVNFRKALDEKPDLYEAEYDIANSLYKQKKYEESAGEYEKLLQKSSDPKKRADLYHNLGNSQIMAQQFDKGVESYKNSLRIRPEDEDTRYNLAYAMEKLKEQQQQQKQDQNKDNKDNKDQKDQDQQKDQQKKEDQKEQENKENQQAKKDDQKKEQQNAAEQKISKEEAEQMLNAVQNQEKDVKEKLDKKKAVARPISTEKDW